jgi:hypothetical protein
MNKRIIIVSIFLLLFCTFLAPAIAGLKNSNPKTACGYLTDIGFKTRGWKNYYDNVYGCSNLKEFGSGFPLRNSVAYYVGGKANKADELKLVLNVNNKKEAKKAHNELLKAAVSLVKKALGADLPKTMRQAIKKGTKATAKMGDSDIKLIRENWPTGKGYELKFIIH